MNHPTLDNTTQEAINALTNQEISRNVNYSFEHSLLWYGVDAVVHAVIMQDAIGNLGKDTSVDNLISQYDLKFEAGANGTGIGVSLRKVEQQGIFIPSQKYHGQGDARRVLFNADYVNMVPWSYETMDTKTDLEALQAGLYITGLIWNKELLSDPETLNKGLRFARVIWKSSVDEFNKYSGPQPVHITGLGIKLIEYYDKIVN